VSELGLGTLAFVTFGHAPLAQGWAPEPEQVRHAARDLTWRVTAVLDGWEHPGHLQETRGQATVTNWWRLKVSGPLPGHPGERGEFIMEVATYGHRPGWWITVEQ
jgi:hypothetical protein